MIAIGSMIGLFLYQALVYLITSSTITKPIVREINMPDDTTNQEEIPLKNVLTVFPIGESKVYFEAKDKNGTLKIDSKEFNELVENQKKIIGKPKFTVVIKATENAKYKDMVDLLDKLAFLRITRYSIVGIAEDENKRIKSFLSNQSR